MKCWKCGEEAVIFRRYEGRGWCKDCFSNQFEKSVKRTVRKNGLVKPGDKVCVGLSGGKDSSVTLKMLKEIMENWRDSELFALAIDEGIKDYRDSSIEIAKKLCKKLGIDLKIISFKEKFGRTLDEAMEKDVKPCTYCGVLRRWILNKEARNLGATKLAVGHNMDDEIQTTMMNYLQGDLVRLARAGAKPNVVEHKKFIPRIKPLRNIPEREVGLYAMLNDLELHSVECPYRDDSLRFDVRDFLNKMENKYPGIKFTTLRNYDSILSVLRKNISVNKKLKNCKNCGELTSRDVCKVCELRKDLENLS